MQLQDRINIDFNTSWWYVNPKNEFNTNFAIVILLRLLLA